MKNSADKFHTSILKRKGIGIFDSGVGGLTVLKEIRRFLPDEDIFYLGDTARVPYGNRSKDTIIKYSIQNTKFLLKFGIKLLVVACNTSSSVAIDTLRHEFKNLPIIGVIEPGSEQAIKTTKNKKIGVIGTRATIDSNSYKLAIKNLNHKINIYQQACPLFVPIVEEGMHKTGFAYDIAKYYLLGLKKHNIDTLILGCTHYPVLSQVIKKVVGNNVKLINSGQAVALKVYEYLMKSDLLNIPNPPYKRSNADNVKLHGKVKFFVTDAPLQFKRIGKLLLSHDIDNNIEKVVLDEYE